MNELAPGARFALVADEWFDGERHVFVTTPVDLPPHPSLRTLTLRVERGRVEPR